MPSATDKGIASLLAKQTAMAKDMDKLVAKLKANTIVCQKSASAKATPSAKAAPKAAAKDKAPCDALIKKCQAVKTGTFASSSTASNDAFASCLNNCKDFTLDVLKKLCKGKGNIDGMTRAQLIDVLVN